MLNVALSLESTRSTGFCFLFEEKSNNPCDSLNASSKFVLFPVFDGSILCLMIILLKAIKKSLALELLFQPPCLWILLKRSSM